MIFRDLVQEPNYPMSVGHTRTYMDAHPYMGTVSIYGNTSTVVLPYMETVSLYGSASIYGSIFIYGNTSKSL